MASELANVVAVAVVRNPRSGALVTTATIAAIEAMVLAGGGSPPLLTAAVTAAVAVAGAGLWWAEGRSQRRLVLDVLLAEAPARERAAESTAEVPAERLDALIASVSAVTASEDARRKVLSDLRRVRDAAAARREVDALAS